MTVKATMDNMFDVVAVNGFIINLRTVRLLMIVISGCELA